jgi:hypothetical protein
VSNVAALAKDLVVFRFSIWNPGTRPRLCGADTAALALSHRPLQNVAAPPFLLFLENTRLVASVPRNDHSSEQVTSSHDEDGFHILPLRCRHGLVFRKVVQLRHNVLLGLQLQLVRLDLGFVRGASGLQILDDGDKIDHVLNLPLVVVIVFFLEGGDVVLNGDVVTNEPKIASQLGFSKIDVGLDGELCTGKGVAVQRLATTERTLVTE